MAEPRAIRCPLCAELLCSSEDPTAKNQYFGCAACGVLFKLIVIDPDLSEALRMMYHNTTFPTEES